MGFFIALIIIPAAIFSFIHDKENRLAFLLVTAGAYWILWKKVAKSEESTLMFWVSVFAFVFMAAFLRDCSHRGGSSGGECVDSGRYGEYTSC